MPCDYTKYPKDWKAIRAFRPGRIQELNTNPSALRRTQYQ